MSTSQQAWVNYCEEPGEARFEAFYETTIGFVNAVALRITRDEDDSNEVVQNVYVELVTIAHDESNWRSVDDIEQLLRQITFRRAEAYRKKSVRDSGRREEVEDFDSFESVRPVQGELAVAREIESKVSTLLEDLPESEKLPLLLYFYHGMSYAEISDALGVSRSSVFRSIQQTLRNLQEKASFAGLKEVLSAVILLAMAGRVLRPGKALAMSSVYRTALLRNGIKTGYAAAAGGTFAKIVASKVTISVAVATLLTVGVIVSGGFFRQQPINSPSKVAESQISDENQEQADDNPKISSSKPHERNSALDAPARNKTSPVTASSAAIVAKGVVFGRVLSRSDMQPVPNSVVEIGDRLIPVQADGHFTVSSLRNGNYNFRASAEAPYLPLSTRIHVDEENPKDLGILMLSRRGQISGELIDGATGKPIPSETVELGDPTTKDTLKTQTDSNGRFAFSNLTFDSYMLIVKRFQGFYEEVKLDELESKHVIVRTGTATFHGRITRTGKAVEGAAIRLVSETENSYKSLKVASRADGTFFFPNLPAGIWTIRAAQEKESPDQVATGTIAIGEYQAASRDFELPSGRVTLQVSVPDHNSAAGLVVSAYNPTSLHPDPIAESTCTVTGICDFDSLAPGKYEVSLLDRGRRLIGSRQIEVPSEGQTTFSLDLQEFDSAGTLRSTALLFPDGRPCQNAWLRFFKDGTWYNVRMHRDKEGVMEIPGLPIGDFQAEVSAYGFSTVREKSFIPAGQVAQITSVLSDAGGIRWSFRDHMGHALPGAQVILRPADTSSIQEPVSGISDHSGVFLKRGILPGQYVATVTTDGTERTELLNIFAQNLAEKLSIIDSSETQTASQ